jgi:hypothetical protein
MTEMDQVVAADKQRLIDEYMHDPPTGPIDPATYKVPGQFTYRGMTLGKFSPVHCIEEVEKLKFDSDDVLLATYPKAGKTMLKILELVVTTVFR